MHCLNSGSNNKFKTMKIAKYVLVACVLAGGFASIAQENGQKPQPPGKKGQVMKALELSDDQLAEIKALREDMKEKRATLIANESLDEASRKEEMKALRAEKKAAIEEILTEEQKMKLAEMKTKHNASRKDLTPGEIADRQTEKMKEVLDLTPEQEEQVRALNLKVALKIDAIKKDDSMSAEKKKEFIKGNKEDKRRMLETILTEDQLKLWDEHLENKRKLKHSNNKSATAPKSE